VTQWVPEDVAIPAGLRDEGFDLRPLRAADAALDHEAYVASPAVISAHSGGRWPTVGFRIEENMPLASQHEADHLARRAFTFLIVTQDGSQSLGCLYLMPLVPYLQRVQVSPEVTGVVPASSAMVTL
jgi:hypothetical protein